MKPYSNTFSGGKTIVFQICNQCKNDEVLPEKEKKWRLRSCQFPSFNHWPEKARAMFSMHDKWRICERQSRLYGPEGRGHAFLVLPSRPGPWIRLPFNTTAFVQERLVPDLQRNRTCHRTQCNCPHPPTGQLSFPAQYADRHIFSRPCNTWQFNSYAFTVCRPRPDMTPESFTLQLLLQVPRLSWCDPWQCYSCSCGFPA